MFAVTLRTTIKFFTPPTRHLVPLDKILLIHVVYADIKPMHILCWTVPSICQRTAEQQPLHMSGFLSVIYAILNASVILERNETRLARNETRLARNETRGGNLPLSGTVYLMTSPDYTFSIFKSDSLFACFISRRKFSVISGTKQHQGNYRRFNLQQSQV